MGLAVAATSVHTKTIRSDAVEEMAPALTEPLSQSKLSSSAASGASPRTSSSTTTTATITATLGATTLLPATDEIVTDLGGEHQQQVAALLEQQVVVEEHLPEHVPEVVEGLVQAVPSGSPTVSSTTVAIALHEVEDGSSSPVGMGMSLPATSGDGASTTVDDIQNNNNTSDGGGQVLKLEDSNRDLVEIALEQLHHDAAIAAGDAPAMNTIAATAVDMGTVMATVPVSTEVPAQVLQQSQPQQLPDFSLMDLNSAPVILSPQPAFQEQQPPVGAGGSLSMQQQQDLSQSSTSSLGGVSGVSGVGGGTELGGLMKESADMDQMIRELSTADIDLLQVLKSFDNNSLLLFSDVDVANLCDPVDGRDQLVHPSFTSPTSSPIKDRERLELHADIAKRQVQMQRKYDFLVRRLNKLVARYMGQHVSEEVAGLFEHTQRFWKKREKEHAKQLHNNNTSSSGGGNAVATVSSTAAHPSEKWPDIIPFQPPPPDITPGPPEKLKPISANALKTFTKRVEGISTTICSVQSQCVLRSCYFHGLTSAGNKSTVPSAPVALGSSSGPGSGARAGYANISNTIPLFERTATQELEQTAGLLHAELRHVQANIDSDATLSSSGGDSADESIPYVNATQEPLAITERASWKWSKDRAAVACRWTWLVARIADLEYRIRQHTELLNKIRTNKGPVAFEELPVAATAGSSPEQKHPIQPPQNLNGYRGQLPGSTTKPALPVSEPSATVATDEEDDAMASCSRARPYCRLRFRKRKLLQTNNLHIVSKRAARPSNFKCGCQWPLHPCALCTGRVDPTAPRDPLDTMPYAERVALLDSCFHSVLSFPEDISHSVHLEAIMRTPAWQNKMIRSTPAALAMGTSGSSHKSAGMPGASARGGAAGAYHSSSFFSSGDETVPSSHGKRYTGSDGKRKYGTNKYKGSNDRSNADSGNRSKKAKSRRDVIMQSSRKSGHGGYPPDGARTGTNGHPSRYYRNKSRKSSHCYDYYDAHDGGVSRSKNSSPTPNHQRNERRPRNSYDIDNIVIPYSMAAATRVSLPQYKDIAIPKWRVVDDMDEPVGAGLLSTDGSEEMTMLNVATDASQCLTSSLTATAGGAESSGKARIGEMRIPPNGTKKAAVKAAAAVASTSGYSKKPDRSAVLDERQVQQQQQQQQQPHQQQLFVMPAQDDEDISEESIMLKHDRALQDERKKFRTYMKFPWSRPRANRRTESRAGSSGGNTPDPTSPAPPTPMVEHDSSPACPSTPLTPQDGQELSEANVINALNKSLIKKERRRTVSSKREEQQAQAAGGGSTTPDAREVVSPYESLQFPLSDDVLDDLIRAMPNDHIALVDDCISKLTGRDGLPLRRSRHRNNNLLLVLKSSTLAPSSLGLGGHHATLSSNASCSSTTLSATETDLEDFDDEDLMLAKRTENQLIMERLLNSRGDSQQYEIVPPTAKPMLGEEDDIGVLDDEETDTGESLFVEEDDPNDPEWHDRPVGSRSAGGTGGGGGASGRA